MRKHFKSGEVDEIVGRLLMPVSAIKNEVQGFSPACDLEEMDFQYLMNFDLPGISKEAIKIEVHENRLTVEGERHIEKRNDGHRPSAVDASHVEASFNEGVLKIVLPKVESAKPREIKISESTSKTFSKAMDQ